MEGYSNYQQVIDAIKAEYVNARDLKRKATATGRKTKSTESFKKRKEVESKSLVDKSKSIDALLDKTLSVSVSDLNKSQFKEFKTKLSELEAKLKYIDSESKRFYLLNQIDPEKYKDATKTEEQTFSVVRNLLATAIKDSEEAIDNIYNGEEYSDIVKATTPNYLTHSEEEVVEYYSRSEQAYVQLFQKAKEAIDNYNTELFSLVDAMKGQYNGLINESRYLVDLKSELATLLENEATQSEIDSKEMQIESVKESMLNNAKDLRIMDAARNEWIFAKFDNVSVFIDDLADFREEFRSFRHQNDSFLTRRPRPDQWVNNETSKLYESLFQALIDNTRNLSEIGDTNEFDLVWDGLQRARNEKVWIESTMNDNHFKLDSLNTNRMFDKVNGEWNGDISDFKKGIKSEYKSFYVDCANELFRATNDYMDQKVRKENLKEQVRHYFYKSDEERYNHERYALILSKTKNQFLEAEFHNLRFQSGHYEGTSEQEQTYYESKNVYIQSHGEYERIKSLVDVKSNKYGVYKTLFPDFFVSLAQYQNSLDNASSSLEAADLAYNDKLATVTTAYDYLQTLTVGEADYVNALAAYEKASEEYQASLDALNLMVVDVDQANSFLQTTLAGEAQYQVAKDNVDAKMAELDLLGANYRALVQASFVLQNELNILISAGADQSLIDAKQAEIDANGVAARAERDAIEPQGNILNNEANVLAAILSSLQPLHYVYLGAQSDYDTKLAAKDTYYTDIVSVNQTGKDDAYNFLQTLTDEDEAYQTALKDWTAESEVLVILSEQKDAASVLLTSAQDELTTHISVTYGEEFSLSISGYELRDAENHLEMIQSELVEAATIKEEASQAHVEARDVMTFVQATPQEKREGMMFQKEMDKRNDQHYRWAELNVNHTEYLSQIKRIITERLEEFRNFAPLDHYLQTLMTFIDGNDQNNRTYINAVRNRMNSEDRNLELTNKMNFYKSCISNFGLDAHFGIFANPNEDILQDITTSNQSLRQALLHTVDHKIQMFPASSFAWAIEDEVNNGNPIVPGQNGGGKS